MDTSLSEVDVFSRNPSVVVRQSDGDFIALDPERGVFFSMNETGEFVFQLLDGRRTLGDVLDRVTEVYAVDKGECQSLVLQLIQDFVRSAFVSKC